MSNPLSDYIADNESDLLESFFEKDEHFKLFEDWLYSKAQDELRDELFNQFARSKEGEKFYSWCMDMLASAGPDEDDVREVGGR